MNIKECRKCDLCITRKHIVNGQGNSRASLMFIGEAPGAYEDRFNIPFYPTAPAGKLLQEMLNKYNFHREDIFITNVVKCRPPQNRKPTILEINRCKAYLFQEIKEVNPKIIVLLGKTAIEGVFGTDINVITNRGKIIDKLNKIFLITYHPSYVTRLKSYSNYNQVYNQYNKDFKKINKLYKLLIDPLHYENT